ncbi:MULTISPECIES: hypothetical protein [Pseudomonadati]|uniref:PilZ domain-containing protein n=1 Tax=Shewanella aestuarii TaxID=1028752 RepID=A0ABT0KWN5_9GAMM|nr:hypothetical protein [Shewanella aestuarii]MCL1115873.1 hypothetical protein [Shewanella aestuarii]GGN69283.1 hypothetical protein GCM10009193_03050 [Shewanella aestuarii]
MINDSNSYFSVPHEFNVYLNAWDNQRPIPDDNQLRQMQSTGLKLLSEVKALEANCLMQLRQLDSETKSIVEFLKLQSRKVDLVLQHVLEKETQTGQQYQGLQFGGSGLSIQSTTPIAVGSLFSCHIYLHAEVVAVLCICKVTAAKQVNLEAQALDVTAASPSWHIELTYTQILDEDIEQLVKASLNVQQKMLKLRKQQRNDNL